jgi:hypothetical protein
MATPEVRREDLYYALEHRDADEIIDTLLSYFDKNEPAVADAIRYGLEKVTVSHYSEIDYKVMYDDWEDIRYEPSVMYEINKGIDNGDS